jgi:hypothetical protein
VVLVPSVVVVDEPVVDDPWVVEVVDRGDVVVVDGRVVVVGLGRVTGGGIGAVVVVVAGSRT